MNQRPRTHQTSFYVQIEPEFFGNDNPQVRQIKAVGLTQKRPRAQRGGTVMVKLTIEVPDGAFLPLRPEATIVIPEGMTVAEPITVEAEDPS
jgi:hypothetical protein